jgi:asparagine synthase (glutamine-hydrolysing)
VSGIVGIFGRDGAPADRPLLESLTHFLGYRGPDGRDVWSNGPAGFGHSLLRTTQESLGERQPTRLDGHLWITADARLDCRAELEAELGVAQRTVRGGAPDAELILHAYAAWGETCVTHLRGDFAFGIWDARTKTMFCARDHFGIKPFYYADLGDLFLFSNTLDCVRLHPGVSEELDEGAIADFLLFGVNYDAASTSYRDVRRLPPAHSLSVSTGRLRTSRYWSAPTDGHIRYRRPDEYIEHFQMLLQAAVADRVHTSRAGVMMSGGLDSSSVAATARELSANSAGPSDLRGYTVTYESLFADRDGHHAREVADFLRMPIRCLPMDGLQPFERWGDPELSWPEPTDDPFFAGLFDQYRMVAADCRVVLSGEGVDNLMHFEMWPYAKYLLRNREWASLIGDSSRYLRIRSSIWPGIRRRAKALFSRNSETSIFPKWFAPDFARRMNLEDRWREYGTVQTSPSHPVVPKAHASLSLPHWSQMFELGNAGVTRCPVEVRYPFLDLRIVNYVLALPPFPWAFEKTLLREAMVGHLPESIRRRSKTPLAGDPLVEMLQRPAAAFLDQACWSEQSDRYINRSALGMLHGETDSERANVAIRPICLNFWLQSMRGVTYNLSAEVRHG